MRLPLLTERLGDGKRKLCRELTVDIDGRTFVAPEGMRTDFSTVPWFGRAVVRWSRVDVAGVIHDLLYGRKNLTRGQCDRIWRLIAQDGFHHANATQAWICWLGLRLGGWWVWHGWRMTWLGPRRG